MTPPARLPQNPPMGWGVVLLLVWAVGATLGLLGLLARHVARAAARKRHGVFSHGKRINEAGIRDAYICRDGAWVREDKREYYRT